MLLPEDTSRRLLAKRALWWLGGAIVLAIAGRNIVAY